MIKKENGWNRVSIVLVNYNGVTVLPDCLKSIMNQRYKDIEILVIDNGSIDNSMTYIEEKYPMIHTIYVNDNIGWGAGCNIGFKESFSRGSEYVLLLNTDTEISEDMIDVLLDESNEETIAVPFMYYDKEEPENSVWYSGGVIDYNIADVNQKIYEYGETSTHFVDFATGCCALIHRNIWDKIGGFDESYFMYFEDVDYCMRLKSSDLKIIYVPYTNLWHKVGGSAGGESSYLSQYYTVRNRLKFAEKYSSKLNISPMNVLRQIMNQRTYFDTPYDKQYRRVVEAAIADYLKGISGKEKNLLFDNYTILEGFYNAEVSLPNVWQWTGDEISVVEVKNPNDIEKIMCFETRIGTLKDKDVEVDIYIDDNKWGEIAAPSGICVKVPMSAGEKRRIYFKIKNPINIDTSSRERILYFFMENAKVYYEDYKNYTVDFGTYRRELDGEKQLYWVNSKNVGISLYNPHDKRALATMSVTFLPAPGKSEVHLNVLDDGNEKYDVKKQGRIVIDIYLDANSTKRINLVSDMDILHGYGNDSRDFLYQIHDIQVDIKPLI